MPHQEFKAADAKDPITFTIGDDPFLFKSINAAPGGSLLAVAVSAGNAQKDDDGIDTVTKTMDFLDSVLEDESRNHFAARFAPTAVADGLEPISLEQAMGVVRFLIGAHSGRPTDEPSPSPAGQSPNGTSSTESSPSKESTS